MDTTEYLAEYLAGHPEHRLRFVRARQEHRAGKFWLYKNLPADVRDDICARVFVVRVFEHDEFLEVHGWSPDFDPVAPGDVLPHYRWMYDTDPLDVSCVKESALVESSAKECVHELREEDTAGIDRLSA